MENGISLKTEVTKESAANLCKIIETIFREGFKNHMDQSTIQEALRMAKHSLEIRNATISNCNIESGKTINT